MFGVFTNFLPDVSLPVARRGWFTAPRSHTYFDIERGDSQRFYSIFMPLQEVEVRVAQAAELRKWGGVMKIRDNACGNFSFSTRVVTFFLGTMLTAGGSLSGQTATPTPTPLTFTQSTNYDVLGLPQSMAIADLDGDGFPDVIVGTQFGLSVVMNKGDGTFIEPPAVYSLPIGGGGVIAADFNGDGFPDVAFPGNGGFGVMLNRGDGTFGPATFFPSSDGLFNVSIAAGDFTHTGRNDVALVDVGFFGCCSTLTLFRNSGNGTFVRAQRLGLSGGAAFVTTADLNKDGFIDLVTGNGNGGLTFSVLTNNKDGTFAPPVDYPVAQLRKAFPADLNHDGNTDLVFVQSEQVRLGVALNRGDGTFLPALITPFFPLGGITDLAVGDLDGDGNVDLATLQEPRLFFSAGNGNGTFHDPGVFLPPAPGQDGDATPIAIADLDNNGALDIITAASPRGVATAIHVRLNSRLPIAPPQIRLSTDHGGNAGSVTITITGQAFASGTTAKLACPGQSDLLAISNSIGADGSLIASFNLIGAVPGTCSVVIVRPDGSTETVPKGFNIEEGGVANVLVDIVGFKTIRAGREQTFYAYTVNNGNIDAENVGIFLLLPRGMDSRLPDGIEFTTYKSDLGTVLSFYRPINAGGSLVIPVFISVPDSVEFAHHIFPLQVWSSYP